MLHFDIADLSEFLEDFVEMSLHPANMIVVTLDQPLDRRARHAWDGSGCASRPFDPAFDDAIDELHADPRNLDRFILEPRALEVGGQAFVGRDRKRRRRLDQPAAQAAAQKLSLMQKKQRPGRGEAFFGQFAMSRQAILRKSIPEETCMRQLRPPDIRHIHELVQYITEPRRLRALAISDELHRKPWLRPARDKAIGMQHREAQTRLNRHLAERIPAEIKELKR